MLGFNHTQTGLIGGLATLPIAPVTSAWGEVSWVVAWGGFALLSDLDAHGPLWKRSGSAVTQMWGPITGLLSRAVTFVARGHRMGTHDLLLAPLGAWLLFTLLVSVGPIGQMTSIALAMGMMMRGWSLLAPGGVGAASNFLVSWSVAWWVVHAGQAAWFYWVPWAAVGGVIVHCLGDLLTPYGLPIPVLWIFGFDTRLSVSLFPTGKSFERSVVSPLTTLVLVGAVWWQTGISSVGELYACVDVLAREAVGQVRPMIWDAMRELGPLAGQTAQRLLER